MNARDYMNVSLSRLEETRWLGRADGAGGENLPDRGWNHDPQPRDDEHEERAA